MSNAKTTDAPRAKEFLGHPVGLWALFTTEMWERFCYYGMRALLVLYLISTLTDSNPGFGWSESDANKLYGWFTGLVYFFPLFGGFIADKFLGQHRSVLLGGSLMALGEFCLFYTEYFRQSAHATITPDSAPAAFWCFILGLFLITLGNGFFKPCISVMVGELYEKNDPRRDDAFNIFYMGINVGAFLAPLVAGSIGEKVSWHWGFLTACLGMIFGLTTYSLLRPKYLPNVGLRKKKNVEPKADAENAESTAAPQPTAPSKLTKAEIDRVAVILTLTFFCIAFWSVFEQAGTALNIFAKKETNRQVPTAVGSAFPGFLANQDELDAKILTNELRDALAVLDAEIAALPEADAAKLRAALFAKEIDIEAASALFAAPLNDEATQVEAGEVETAPTETAEAAPAEIAETAPVETAENARPETLIAAFDAVASAYNEASFALNKANGARLKAGQEALALPISNFEALLVDGKLRRESLQAQVDEAAAARADELAAASEEERDAILAGLEQDALKKRQATFLADEAKKLDKKTAIYTFPTTWYQSVNPFCVVIFAPLFNILWGFLRRRGLEPSTPVKFGIGLVLLSVAFFFMVGGALHSVETGGNAGAYWLLCCYVFCTWGELCLSPVGLSMVSRLAPARYASMLMGVWFLSSAIAGYLSGYLAAWLGSGENGSVAFCFGRENGLADYFLLMALAPMVAGLIVFALAPKLRKMTHENE
ncbi:MAG: MFS transporter [Thermoguttaceae bacterium]|nr:MFS transporter [Thermoguttaceae bacterium]MBQ9800921.1 MFS transporter [Thermoguttaceae bacterium]